MDNEPTPPQQQGAPHEPYGAPPLTGSPAASMSGSPAHPGSVGTPNPPPFRRATFSMSNVSSLLNDDSEPTSAEPGPFGMASDSTGAGSMQDVKHDSGSEFYDASDAMVPDTDAANEYQTALVDSQGQGPSGDLRSEPNGSGVDSALTGPNDRGIGSLSADPHVAHVDSDRSQAVPVVLGAYQGGSGPFDTDNSQGSTPAPASSLAGHSNGPGLFTPSPLLAPTPVPASNSLLTLAQSSTDPSEAMDVDSTEAANGRATPDTGANGATQSVPDTPNSDTDTSDVEESALSEIAEEDSQDSQDESDESSSDEDEDKIVDLTKDGAEVSREKDAEKRESDEEGPVAPPKKRKRHVWRSPPPVDNTPKPEKTIRLSFEFPHNPHQLPVFDIRQIALAKGFQAPSEPAEAASDDEESRIKSTNQELKKTAGEEPPEAKRRKRVVLGRFGGYDVEDPFVDDSDIALYEPKYYHRPKKEGYYIFTGPLELQSKFGRRNKKKEEPLPPASFLTTRHLKTTLPDNAAVTNTLPVFGSTGDIAFEAVVRKRPKGTFSAELQAQLDMLRAEVAKESFAVKTKFPPRLRPILLNVALKALELDEYDDDFFAVLPKIFPYNTFTMKKLVKREIFPKRIELLTKDQSVHFGILKKGISESLEPQWNEYMAARAVWLAKVEEYNRANPTATVPAAAVPTLAPAPVPIASAGSLAPQSSPSKEEPSDNETNDSKAPKEPVWKFRFTEQMRHALYHIVALEDEMTDLIIEKQTLERATERDGPLRERPYTQMAARKAIYAKIVNMWPDDKMTTNQLSRERSRYQKESGLAT